MPEFALTRVVFRAFSARWHKLSPPEAETPEFRPFNETRREASEDGGLAAPGLASRGLAVRLFARNARFCARRGVFGRIPPREEQSVVLGVNGGI